MSDELIVIARIAAKEEKIDLVKSELQNLITPTLEEEGCIQYDLHQDNDDPSVFIFYEIWESLKHLTAHSKSSHITDLKQVTKDTIESSSSNKMTKV